VQGETEGEVRALQREVESVRGQMGELKTALYAKFGNAINLEE
jgi:chaperonin cofactor prefoldin